MWLGSEMNKIAVITSTRAEFGLLLPLIHELRDFEGNDFKVDVVVTGTHLSQDYGYTIQEIVNSNVRIDHTIEVSVKSNSAIDISKNQAEILVKFTKLFEDQNYQGIVILGDRYEMLSIAIAAGNTHTPIFHLCGGDTTEGAIDEWIRHSITKMSYLHFVTNEDSYRRVIQLGEDPSRVFNYGSTSIDNILNSKKLDKKDALASIGLSDCKYALCTYHPVTLDKSRNVEKQINEFLMAISSCPNIEFIVTKANADEGGARINEILDEANKKISNLHVYTSLGMKRYLSLMQNAEFVLGNSSSGIIETPSFKIPTINIGNRQRGRVQANTIINCKEDAQSILEAIQLAKKPEFLEQCLITESPYGKGDAAERIAEEIYSTVMTNKIDLKKVFYNLEV